MEMERATAGQRRVQAVAIGMGAFADHGLTTAAVQHVADRLGLSQPYVFRLFGSQQAFFLACLDELEERFRAVIRRAAAAAPDVPLPAMRAEFRDLLADEVHSGLWMQASALVRRNDKIARRLRALIAGVLAEVDRLATTTPDELLRFVADGALTVQSRALGVDVRDGIQDAVESLRKRPVAEAVAR
ncbi:conserved hypothetical protein [Micromonospora sp. ATCC 39149]|uniref:TetR/AcrR family transcriptional regulator n=1 Tax=Micromonospora carbonacea TaxID=47853 RepID=A0A7D5YGA1_9ACTN|nr:TetR family transcriptional regulator [Micromonospora sp. ATCC 39149]EEP70575.1 conserved hypothetical protein [Micromonospora sp. ATCC 39149]QLJ96954.1 TetR/AcrR family transcriptional regulator [Micromonospora carbonacea]